MQWLLKGYPIHDLVCKSFGDEAKDGREGHIDLRFVIVRRSMRQKTGC